MTYFRAIAILFIVLGHTVWGKGIMLKTLMTLLCGGTTYFVFIAGFLFQYLSYKFNYKEYLKKKFYNVIMPYIVTILPFAIILSVTINNPQSSLYNLSKPVRFIICFPCGLFVNGPAWFIGMISIYFLLAPIFLKLEKNKKVWYSLLLISIIYSIFVNRPDGNLTKYMDCSTGAVKQCLSVFYNVYLQSFVYFLSSYIGGMTLCSFVRKHPDFIFKYKKIILTVLVTALIITYFIYTFLYFNVYRQFLIKTDITLLIFCLLYIYEKVIVQQQWLDKCLRVLAKYSFGIFFIHDYFLKFMLYNDITYRQTPLIINRWEDNSIGTFLYMFCTFYVALFGSLCVLWLIKSILNKLGIKNTRMFIGV